MRDDYVRAPMMVAAFGGVALFAVAMGMAVSSIAHHHPASPPPKAGKHIAHPLVPSAAATPPAPTAVAAVHALSADAGTVEQIVTTPVPNVTVLGTVCAEVKNLVLPPLPAGTAAAATTRLSDIVLDDVALQRLCGTTIVDVAASNGPGPVTAADTQRVSHAVAVLRVDIGLFSAAVAQP